MTGLLRIISDRIFHRKPQSHDSAHSQARPDQFEDMTLYYSPGCLFCLRVQAAIRLLGLRIAGKNILFEPAAGEELSREGGRHMVPCLRIQEGASTRWLYESGDIIDYLHTRAEC